MLLALLLAPLPALAQARVALVIGNATYAAAGRLANPLNDARAMARMLEGELGFRVTVVTDGGRAAMVAALDRFAAAADRADVALFFYAGHALEVGGVNHLLPVDARIGHEREVETQSVSLNAVLARMEGARVRVLFLDACRDNPLAAAMVRSQATRSLTRGLAEVTNAPRGTLIAFATAPGQVAADGPADRNSPFTAALLRHLPTPGEDLRVVMGAVVDSVQAATRDRNPPQVPWQSTSLGGGRVVLKGGAAAAPAPVPVPAPAPAPAQQAVVAPPVRQSLEARPATGFACPPAGTRFRYRADGREVVVAYDGTDAADPAVCLAREGEGAGQRLLYNFYPVPMAGSEEVVRREVGELLRGARRSASFVMALGTPARPRFFEDTWLRLDDETITVEGRAVAAMVLQLDRSNRLEGSFRARLRYWFDPARGLWLKREVTMWGGDAVPSYAPVAVGR